MWEEGGRGEWDVKGVGREGGGSEKKGEAEA